MQKVKDRIFRQHNIGVWGRFSLASSQIAVFVSSFTLLMVMVNAYTPISVWLSGIGINLSFLVFMAIVISPIAVAYFLAWKFLVASMYRSSTEQFWEQSKSQADSIAKVDRIEKMLSNELHEIKQRLSELEK